MNKEQLSEILELHKLWLNGEGGKRANLREANLFGADLREANLFEANLREANLFGADLRGANLFGANLREANLREADLFGANLFGANLFGANLFGADLREANLREADLFGANLFGADLRGANLFGANLRGAVGNQDQLKSIFLDRWPIAYTADVMQIGCQHHKISEWWEFSDDTISSMEYGALEWWKKYKPLLKQIIETSPATPTQDKES